MKKFFLFILAICAAVSMSAASYGILLNGETYYAGEHIDDFEGFTQYKALVPVKAGDYCQLYDADNQAAWAVDLSTWSVEGFTRNDNKYEISVTGCYVFYIKLKYGEDELYIGEGTGCVDPETAEYYIAGEGLPGVSWGDHKKITDKTITFSDLAAGTYKFKITGGNFETFAWGASKVNTSCSSSGYYSDNDGNICVTFTSDGNKITVKIVDNMICLTLQGEVQEVYASAVPSQCEDVLMQAFFYDSYNNDAPGAEFVGNTRWSTLLPQAEEIGKYIDLIWLPPSANGSGTGYHPKEYSNQNSAWGSRSELEALIGAFHNAGAKVIADIVINHCEGWTSWCDFPTMDFGEYGVFHPDASYICKDDEVNADWNKESAGACWGTATGNYDDGANWDGARDWAHDNVYVQDFFKAYLKWMRNVMRYDGFRYDKGDGFNNWHHDNYNKAAGPYIAFMECYSNTDEIKSRLEGANYNLMALDFDTKWHVFDSFAGWDFSRGRGNGLLGQNWGKHAVVFIDSHDWFMRGDNENEFGGRGNSLTDALKARLLMANAFMLSMPGVPCVFYPHWAKYKEFIKPMIEARKLAGVHSESEVKDEYVTSTGYQATIVGKYGYLILCLGDKAHQDFSANYKLMASYYAENDANSGKDGSYQIWVNRTAPLPTTVEAVESQTQKVEIVKFIEDGKLLIRMGDKTYDIMGNAIK